MNQDIVEANIERDLWLKEPGGFLVYHIPHNWVVRFGVNFPSRDYPERELFCYAPVTTAPNSSVATGYMAVGPLQRMEEITRETALEIHERCVATVDEEVELWRRTTSETLAAGKWGYAVHAYVVVRVKVMVPVESADCPNAAVSLADSYLSHRVSELLNNDSPPVDDGDLVVSTIEYADEVESFLVDTLNDNGDPIEETRFDGQGQLLRGDEGPAPVPRRSRQPPVDPTPTPREDRTRSIVLEPLHEGPSG